jgi:hypothetical protein
MNNLKLAETTMERGPGSSEEVCVLQMLFAIHKCMEAMLGISLYSYLYLKLAKTLCLSYYLLFSLQQIRGEGRTGSVQKQGEVARTMYTHVSKCKNDKIKVEKKKIQIQISSISMSTMNKLRKNIGKQFHLNSLKKNQNLGINFIKDENDYYKENYKPLREEIKQDH